MDFFYRWKAPADFEGEVFFRFSTVVDYDKYWVNVDGPKIRVSRSAETSETESKAPVPANTESPDRVAETTERDSPIVFPADDEKLSNDEKLSSVAIDQPVAAPTLPPSTSTATGLELRTLNTSLSKKKKSICYVH